MAGWKHIVVDGKPAIVRFCYVLAWNDPDWRRVNRLPERVKRKRAALATTTEAE